MNDDEEMNRLAVQAQILQRQSQVLQNQMEVLQTSITDLNASIDTLQNLPKAKETGILPIGSGVYITCHKVETEGVLVSIGAGLLANKSADEAVEILRKRLKAAGESFERAQKTLMQLNSQMQDLSIKAGALSAKMEDVRPSQG